MKKTFTIFIVLILFQVSVFTQTKFDEYKNIKNDNERFIVVKLLDYLIEHPETKALFLVYATENEASHGNVLGYLEGVKKYISDKNFDLRRIDFAVTKGKETFTKEIWIIEKGENQPQFERLEYDFDNLKEDYLYGSVCFICEPAYEEFTRTQIDFENLSQIVKNNSNYSVLLKIGKNSAHFDFGLNKKISPKKYADKIKNLLTTKYKLDKKRFKYEIVKDSDIGEFYLIPEKQK